MEQYKTAACLNVFLLLLNRRTSFFLREDQGTSRWLTLGQAAMNNKEVRALNSAERKSNLSYSKEWPGLVETIR